MPQIFHYCSHTLKILRRAIPVQAAGMVVLVAGGAVVEGAGFSEFMIAALLGAMAVQHTFKYCQCLEMRFEIDEHGIRYISGGSEERIAFEDISKVVLPSHAFRGYWLQISGGETEIKTELRGVKDAVMLIEEGLRMVGNSEALDEEDLARFYRTHVYNDRRRRRLSLIGIPTLATVAAAGFWIWVIAGGVAIFEWSTGAPAVFAIVSLLGPALGWLASGRILARKFRDGTYAQPNSTLEQIVASEYRAFAISFAVVGVVVMAAYGAYLFGL